MGGYTVDADTVFLGIATRKEGNVGRFGEWEGGVRLFKKKLYRKLAHLCLDSF